MVFDTGLVWLVLIASDRITHPADRGNRHWEEWGGKPVIKRDGYEPHRSVENDSSWLGFLILQYGSGNNLSGYKRFA